MAWAPLQLTSQTTVQVQATLRQTLNFWSGPHAALPPWGQKHQLCPPALSQCCSGMQALGPQVRTSPPPSQRENAGCSACEPCRASAAEVRGLGLGMGLGAGERNRIMSGGGRGEAAGHRLGGLEERGVGKYNCVITRLELSSLERPAPRPPVARGAEVAPWVTLQPLHLLSPQAW